MNNACVLKHFPGNSASFKYKQKTTGSAGNDGTKPVHIMVPLKYLSNFWRTLGMPLITCENNHILTWSANCFICNATNNHGTIFAITDTKPYVSVVTLSTDDNVKLLQRFKSGFKPLGLTVAGATDAAIHQKIFGFCTRSLDFAKRTALIISNEEMNDITKIGKSLEESGLLIKDVSETIKNEPKSQKGGFLGMLLGASLLGNLLSGKDTIRAGESTIRASQYF